MKYLVRLYRLGEGKRREKGSVMIMEREWDANEDFAGDIGEQAGGLIEEAVACDVAVLQEKSNA